MWWMVRLAEGVRNSCCLVANVCLIDLITNFGAGMVAISVVASHNSYRYTNYRVINLRRNITGFYVPFPLGLVVLYIEHKN